LVNLLLDSPITGIESCVPFNYGVFLWSLDLKKKKPRRENRIKVYNQITDLDEYPRTEYWGEKKAKKKSYSFKPSTSISPLTIR